MGSWAGGGDEVASTRALAPAHCCHLPEKTSAGGRGLWTRQPVVWGTCSCRGSEWYTGPKHGCRPVSLPKGGDTCLQLDQGDEGFIGTIPPLIHLDAVKDTVAEQRKITQAFGEAFDLC